MGERLLTVTALVLGCFNSKSKHTFKKKSCATAFGRKLPFISVVFVMFERPLLVKADTLNQLVEMAVVKRPLYPWKLPLG
jgi:hypothetical protein